MRRVNLPNKPLLWVLPLLLQVGHKFGAPKGVAALYIREGIRGSVVPFLCGGGQERERRAGTENVLLIVGLGEAARIAACELDATAERMRRLRDRLQAALVAGQVAWRQLRDCLFPWLLAYGLWTYFYFILNKHILSL